MSRKGHYRRPHQGGDSLSISFDLCPGKGGQRMPSVWAKFAQLTGEIQGMVTKGFCNVFCIFPISSSRSWGLCSWYAFTPIDTCHLATAKSWDQKSCRRGGSFDLCWYVNARFRFWLSCKWLITGHLNWPMSLTVIVSCLLPNPGAMENTSD